MKVTVVGGGKIGLPLGVSLCRNGACVSIFDKDATLVRNLNDGACPHDEPYLKDWLAEAMQSGLLKAYDANLSSIAEASDVIVIVVPVGLGPNRSVSLQNF